MLLLAAAAFAVPVVELEPQDGGGSGGTLNNNEEVKDGYPGMTTDSVPVVNITSEMVTTSSSDDPATEQPTLMADCFKLFNYSVTYPQ